MGARTKCPKTKRPMDKTSQGQNVPGTKRPKGQNVPRDKTSQGQNVPRTKRPTPSFQKLRKLATYVR